MATVRLLNAIEGIVSNALGQETGDDKSLDFRKIEGNVKSNVSLALPLMDEY